LKVILIFTKINHFKLFTARTLTQPYEEVHHEAHSSNEQEQLEPELHRAATPQKFHFQIVHRRSQVVARSVHVIVHIF